MNYKNANLIGSSGATFVVCEGENLIYNNKKRKKESFLTKF